MPKQGDKLYSFFAGELEEVTFVREQILPGASLPTYLILHKDNSKASCPTDMYKLSKKEAYLEWVKMAEEAIPGLEKQKTEIEQTITETKAKIAMLNKMIESL